MQVQQIQVPQQQIVQPAIVQQQVVQQVPQQYAVVQENSLNNGTRQIYFVDSSNNSNETVNETQNQQQPIVLNHQIGQNNTVRVRTPGQTLPVRAGPVSGVRQQLTQVIDPQIIF